MRTRHQFKQCVGCGAKVCTICHCAEECHKYGNICGRCMSNCGGMET